VRQFHYEERG